jgi:hypothetical protein
VRRGREPGAGQFRGRELVVALIVLEATVFVNPANAGLSNTNATPPKVKA